jgi:hypothetical protein
MTLLPLLPALNLPAMNAACGGLSGFCSTRTRATTTRFLPLSSPSARIHISPSGTVAPFGPPAS